MRCSIKEWPSCPTRYFVAQIGNTEESAVARSSEYLPTYLFAVAHAESILLYNICMSILHS